MGKSCTEILMASIHRYGDAKGIAEAIAQLKAEISLSCEILQSRLHACNDRLRLVLEELSLITQRGLKHVCRGAEKSLTLPDSNRYPVSIAAR
jgi:hypothetical protein